MTPRNNLAEDWSCPVLGNLDMAGVVMNASLVFKERAAWQAGLTQACFAEGTTLDDETLEGWVSEGLRSSDYATVSYWIDLAMSDWRSFVGEIEIPVLLCHGARSLACPLEAGRWLERTIPAAERVVFEHSGHAPSGRKLPRSTPLWPASSPGCRRRTGRSGRQATLSDRSTLTSGRPERATVDGNGRPSRIRREHA